MAHDSPQSGTNPASTEARVEAAVRPLSPDLADYLQSGTPAPKRELICHAKAVNDLLTLHDPNQPEVDDLDPPTVSRAALLAKQLLEAVEGMEAHEDTAAGAEAERHPAVSRLR